MFCEVSPELAAERGLEHGGWATIVTRADRDRGAGAGDRADQAAARSRAAPSTRSGCPTTGATAGSATGDAANDLFPLALDPNVHIQEVKAATCDIVPGRRPRGRDAASSSSTSYRRAGRGGGARRTRSSRHRPGRRATARKPSRGSGFFTDTRVCIGCKACEVACKEWNQVPDDGSGFTGDVLRQHRRARRRTAGATSPSSSSGRPVGVERRRARLAGSRRPRSRASSRQGLEPHDRRRRLPLADELRRLQALHRGRLPRRLPDRRALPHRVRHGRRPGGHLQRLRLLRRRLPVRRARPARGRRPRLEVHALLRPAEGRHGAGLRAGLPDRLDPVRRARRAARAGRPTGRASCTSAGVAEARLYGDDRRTTASAASAPSSCCSTSRRSTGCRPTRS